MKKSLYLLINIFLFVSTLELAAHCDFHITQNFGNVSLRIKTGYFYEEIRKVMIIGKLAEMMCKELDYKDTVFLDFNHFYTNEKSSPAYFISFDDGCIRNLTYENEIDYTESDFDHDVLVIRQGAYDFDPVKTLKLLEYSIKNLKKIDSEQRQISFDSNYCHFIIFSIDTNLIKSLLCKKNSELIDKLLKIRINRITPVHICYQTKDDDFADIDYYYQYGKYHINFVINDYYKGMKERDSSVLSLDNIRDFRYLNYGSAMVFDTDSTFYFLKNWNGRIVSKKNTIKFSKTWYYWTPKEINYVGGNKILIYYGIKILSKEEYDLYKTLYRHLLYYIDKDILIQDLDEIIKPETIK